MAKDYCKASIKDSPRLGDLHCDKLAKIDNLCGQHGRMFDSGKPITWAKADAPTLNQVYDCWQRTTFDQRAHVRDHMPGNTWAGMSAHQWEVLHWLRAWELNF